MRELRLVAVSEDGTRLILRTDGEESPMALPVDERLHAAMRGDRARLGQLEIQMDSQLRPRDIQARVRSGESVESVAAAAGVPLDRVMRYAGAVLAEREHIAGRARRATIRRSGGDGPAPLLEDAIARWVGQSDIDPDSVVWDAWRRDDGRWQVSASWQNGAGARSARFAFDPAGRSVAPDDDEANAIAGERASEPVVASGPARLSVVAGVVSADTDESGYDDESASTSPPDIAVVEDEDRPEAGPDPDDQPTAPVPVTARRGRRDVGERNGRGERRRSGSRTGESGADLWSSPADVDDDEPSSDRLRLSDIASRIEIVDDGRAVEEPADEEPTEAVPARRAAGSARSRRPSVPSWDEIMFGRRRKPD